MDKPTEEILIKLMDRIHEMSMSKRDYEACTGRCLKEFFLKFNDFEAVEESRGTPRYEVVFSILAACSMIVGSTVLAAARPTHRRDAADAAIQAFSETMNDMLKDYAESKGVEGSNTRH